MQSIAGFEEASPSEDFSKRMLTHIEQNSWKTQASKPVPFIRMVAAALLVLAIFNGITLTFSNNSRNSNSQATSSPQEMFVQEYSLETGSYMKLSETK